MENDAGGSIKHKSLCFATAAEQRLSTRLARIFCGSAFTSAGD
jgi:hypothetical protein